MEEIYISRLELQTPVYLGLRIILMPVRIILSKSHLAWRIFRKYIPNYDLGIIYSSLKSNSYCQGTVTYPIWIFIFDTDQAQIYTVVVAVYKEA